MKLATTLLSALLLSSVVSGTAQDSRDEYAYFLVSNLAELDFLGRVSLQSCLIPISKDRPDDILHARAMINGEASRESSRSRPIIRVIREPDGINRDYAKMGAPLWSWHAEFVRFGSTGAPQDRIGTPTGIEKGIEIGRFSRDELHMINYVFVAELRFPTVKVDIQKVDSGIVLTWRDLGDYRYTVEVMDSETGKWTAAPEGDWPIRANRWESQDTSAEKRFYRVTAQLGDP